MVTSGQRQGADKSEQIAGSTRTGRPNSHVLRELHSGLCPHAAYDASLTNATGDATLLQLTDDQCEIVFRARFD